MNKYPERNAEIVRLRDDGWWPAQIATFLGLSRNTVIGVLNRHGRCSPDTNKSEILQLNAARGERVGASVLTAQAVRAIRRDYRPFDRDYSVPALASRYGVHPSTIQAVLAGRTWSHVA